MRLTVWLGVMACGGGTNGGPKDTTEGGGAPLGGTWELVADDTSSGVLLGAIEVGGELVVAGGQLALGGAGSGSLARYDGDRLCVEDDVADAALWWLDGEGTDFWAVGDRGVVLQDEGGQRTRQDIPSSATLYGVWDAGDEVWAVGGDPVDTQTGEIWRRDVAGTWTLELSTEDLMFKAFEGWMVGYATAFFWDGSDLLQRHPPNRERLFTVDGSGPDDVWAVGGLGAPAVLHWHDGAWETIETDLACMDDQLNGVWVAPDGAVWVAGNRGISAVLRHGEWSCPEERLTDDTLHVVHGFGDEVLFFGGNLDQWGDNHGTVVRWSDNGAPVQVGGPCN